MWYLEWKEKVKWNGINSPAQTHTMQDTHNLILLLFAERITYFLFLIRYMYVYPKPEQFIIKII